MLFKRGLYFVQLLIETGALFEIGHYSREGSNRASMVLLAQHPSFKL